MSEKAISLGEYKKQSTPLEFQRVALTGRFSNNQEMHVGLRSRGAAGEDSGGGGLIGNASNAGYFVYTPFDTEDGDRVIVNRGWIPRGNQNPKTRPDAQVDSRVTIEAVTREGEDPSAFPKNVPEQNVWYSIDVDAMAKATNGSPILLDMIADSKVNAPLLRREGAPLARGSQISLRNNHLSYAITWYGMSGIMAAMIFRRYGGR
ncbi:Surfeit locus protein 1 [Chytridiales sp. JEL 0842]|nr:Surfeit locus protein 1 [Chytridiales sp. JEL 0842]